MLYLISLIFVLISVFLVWFLVSHDRGPKEPIGALWIASGCGLLALVLANIFEAIFVKSNFITTKLSLADAFFATLKVGYIEETVKFLPLALIIYNRKYFNEHNDGIVYFAICGLTFGFFENFLYTFGWGLSAGIGRLIMVPVFHAAGTAIIGYYLARKKIDHRSWWSVVVAFILVGLIHSLYNFGLISQVPTFLVMSLMLTVFLAVSLFVLYNQSNIDDRVEGISASHQYKYCPSCGKPNADHSVFCESCGVKF